MTHTENKHLFATILTLRILHNIIFKESVSYIRNPNVVYGRLSYKINKISSYHASSGGAGYVISREALNRWAHRPPGKCIEDGDKEDFVLAVCLASLGVKAGDSRDCHGRQRFIPSRVDEQVTDTIPAWRREHNKFKGKKVRRTAKLTK